MDRCGLTSEVGIDDPGQIWDQPDTHWTPQPWMLGGRGSAEQVFQHWELGHRLNLGVTFT